MNGFHSETAGHWFAEVFLERYVDMNAKITPIKPNGDAIPCWERNCGREGEGDVITFLDLRILRHDADAPTPTCSFCIHLHNVRRIPKSCDGVHIEQTFQKTVSKNVFFHFGHNSSIYLLRSYPLTMSGCTTLDQSVKLYLDVNHLLPRFHMISWLLRTTPQTNSSFTLHLVWKMASFI